MSFKEQDQGVQSVHQTVWIRERTWQIEGPSFQWDIENERMEAHGCQVYRHNTDKQCPPHKRFHFTLCKRSAGYHLEEHPVVKKDPSRYGMCAVFLHYHRSACTN
ncbi:hypothetical protein TNCT_152481 [Trichonephila clavata]|uniref:Uncharacterized protein n=1 Tax=Trichonephila clavata TaxID=2740835 RepID=A0A8X6GDF7_TRICU|nr:hypothetical protein TNCT_152481 [Trichonephila clavata]